MNQRDETKRVRGIKQRKEGWDVKRGEDEGVGGREVVDLVVMQRREG